jgi:hypothetical protein
LEVFYCNIGRELIRWQIVNVAVFQARTAGVPSTAAGAVLSGAIVPTVRGNSYQTPVFDYRVRKSQSAVPYDYLLYFGHSIY